MKTFILFWNEKISKYDSNSCRLNIKAIQEANSTGYYYDNLYLDSFIFLEGEERIDIGDHFFVVRNGGTNRGICMCGVFESFYYEVKSKSATGKIVFDMQMIPRIIIDPYFRQILQMDQLIEKLPNIAWENGEVGHAISDIEAEILEKLWDSFLTQSPRISGKYAVRLKYDLSRFIPSTTERVFWREEKDGKINAHTYYCDFDEIFDDIDSAKKSAVEFLHDKYGKWIQVEFVGPRDIIT